MEYLETYFQGANLECAFFKRGKGGKYEMVYEGYDRNQCRKFEKKLKSKGYEKTVIDGVSLEEDTMAEFEVSVWRKKTESDGASNEEDTEPEFVRLSRMLREKRKTR